MKTKRALLVAGLIGVLAFLSAVYCFWLMTVPLDYDLVYLVLGGFIVSLVVFVSAVIGSIIIAIRLHYSRRAPAAPPITPVA